MKHTIDCAVSALFAMLFVPMAAVAQNASAEASAESPASGECKKDMDCKGDRVCFNGRCLSPDIAKQYEKEEMDKSAPPLTAPVGAAGITAAPQGNPDNLGPNESGLLVVLRKPAQGAVVYVDGQNMGTLPWRGVVAPGEHTVRVEALKKNPKTIDTTVWPARTRTLEVKLRREGNYAPFAAMAATTAVFLPVGFAGLGLYLHNRSDMNRDIDYLYSSVQTGDNGLEWEQLCALGEPLYEYDCDSIERNEKEKQRSAAMMGASFGIAAVSLPLSILFGIHPEWFGKRSREKAASVMPFLSPDSSGLLLLEEF